MINPKISVIIPIFNGEKYLKKCLDSIINQTFKDFEIICINDGSTDNSIDILNKFSKKDSRIKVISTKNNGQGSARNIGLKNANGEYISFIDADDWIKNNSFELLYEKSKNYDLDMLFFQMINYIESTCELIETDLYNYESILNNFDSDFIFSNNDVEDFLFDIAVCPVSKFYKKSFLDKFNIKFSEGMIFEDNIFFYNSIIKAKKMSYIKEKLYFRRRHSESVTQNITKKSSDIILATNSILMLFKNEGIYDKFKINIINHVFSMVMEWFFKADLIISDYFFIEIKNNSLMFKDFAIDFESHLNSKNYSIYKLFIKNNFYLDFLTEYILLSNKYSSSVSNSVYKISVIIPVYNTKLLLHRTLMSLMHQSIGFNNIEIILIDDNSDIETYEIVDFYSKNFSNINVLHLNETSGSAGTPRNIGINMASSEYIMFLDHDDYFEFDSLEKLYDIICNNDVDVVFGTYSVIQNNQYNNILYPNEQYGYFKSIDENERFIGFPSPSIWTKLFKKSVIIENNILFPPILGEDAIFWNKFLLNASGIYYLHDDIICFHDLTDNSTTNNVTFKYLMEGIYSEKYLWNLFKYYNKEYLFRFRCECNIDFFLSQFLKSNINKDELISIFSIFRWFLNMCYSFNIQPNNDVNKILFNYFINGDIDKIYNFKIKISKSNKYNFIFKIFGEKYTNIFKKLFIKLKKIFIF